MKHTFSLKNARNADMKREIRRLRGIIADLEFDLKLSDELIGQLFKTLENINN